MTNLDKMNFVTILTDEDKPFRDMHFGDLDGALRAAVAASALDMGWRLTRYEAPYGPSGEGEKWRNEYHLTVWHQLKSDATFMPLDGDRTDA